MKGGSALKKRPSGQIAQKAARRLSGFPVTIWKKLCFSAVVTLLSLLACELALWCCGVKPGFLSRDPYAGLTPVIPHFLVEKGPAGKPRLTVAPKKLESLNPQTFAAEKPAGTYRIICLGGSTTYGRPFFDLTSYPGWLREFLPVADPARRWEVINAGALSYASYRVKGLMAELAGYQPDLFVVDVGHNEFLERRTYAQVFETPVLLRYAAGLLSRTRTATLLQNGLQLAGLLPTPGAFTQAAGIQEEVKRVPVYAVGPEAYKRDETFEQNVLGHFRSSLDVMVEIARSAGARILFIVPASNLRDFAPFKSEHRRGLSDRQRLDWTDAFERGRALAREHKLTQAVEAFHLAEMIDDRHADLLFQAGQALFQLERHAEARARFVRARDEDICPLRATSKVTQIIREVARERAVPLVDFEALLAQRARHGVPGAAEFVDHVHHQIATNRRLARDLIEALAAQKILGLSPAFNDDTVARVTRDIEAKIDKPRYAGELRSLATLLMELGQSGQSIERAREALELTGEEPGGLTFLGQQYAKAGNLTAAAACCRRAVALQPDSMLAREGLAIVLLQQSNPAEALDHLLAVALAKPESYKAQGNLGLAYMRLKRVDAAIAQFRKALLLKPDEPALHLYLGQAEESRGNPAEAANHYQQVLRLQPGQPEARLRLERLAHRSG